MAIFPSLDLESTIQVDDSTRLNATRSLISKGEAPITLVEIEPEAAAGFIDVTGSSAEDYYLDWQYSGTSRTATVSVRITTDGLPVTFTKDISVVTVADDGLFSNDQDLTAKEEDILRWLPKGRNSYLNIHRKVLNLILDDFSERGVTDNTGAKLTKASFVDLDEVREWSATWTLALIFQDISNIVGDVFSQKSQLYSSQAEGHRTRAFFRIDLDNDGTIEAGERSPFKTVDLVRS